MRVDHYIERTGLDIRSVEFLLHFGGTPDLEEPLLGKVNIGGTLTDAILWYGTASIDFQPGFPIGRPQEVFYFPVIPPAIKEWEYTHPAEWRVRFVGTKTGLAQSPAPTMFQNLISTLADDERIVLLQTKQWLKGFGGVEMGNHLYVAGTIARGEQGRLVYPAPYTWP